MISNGNLHAMTFSYFVDVDAVHGGDAVLYAAPMSHGAGLLQFHGRAARRPPRDPQSGAFDPAEVLALARALRDVTMFAAPTMVRRLIDRARATARAATASAPSSTAAGRCTCRTSSRRLQCWGRASCRSTARARADDHHGACAGLWPTAAIRAGASGWAGRARAVLRHDPHRRRGRAAACRGRDRRDPGARRSRDARLLARCEATAKTIRDGWLWTGDMGALDADGFLTLKDRSKDVIISGGSNVYPREVEEVLLLHPALQEASVVGRPSREWGGRGRLRGGQAGGRARSRRSRPSLSGAHRPLQAAQMLLRRDGAAEEQLRQGAQDRAARAPRKAPEPC